MLRNLFGMGSMACAPSFDDDGGTSGGSAAGAAGGADGGEAGGQAPEGGAAGGGSDPGGSGAAPETYTLKVNGKDETYTRAEFEELASKGGNYTKDKQALAEERKTWEHDRDSLVRTEVDRRVEDMIAEDRNKAEVESDLTPQDKTENRLNRLEAQRQDDALETKITGYKDKYGKDFNRSMFIDAATQAGARELPELDAIAEKHVESMKSTTTDNVKAVLADENHPLTKEFASKIVEAYIAKKAGQHPAGGGGSTGPTEIPTGKDGKPMTDDEIDAAAIADLESANI